MNNLILAIFLSVLSGCVHIDCSTKDITADVKAKGNQVDVQD